jgi:trehalose 6-phosphate phosphatase
MLRDRGNTFLPIYVGDDLTDEPAFRVLRKGITVLVGPRRPTNAHFSLRNPAQVGVFLERLERLLP